MEREQAERLFNHARNCFSILKEMLLYAFLWNCGPWSFVQLLHPNAANRRQAMEEIHLKLRPTAKVYYN